MPMASVKQVKVMVRSTQEALANLARTDILYKFGVTMQLPTQAGLTLEQVQTCLRKLDESLSSYREESPIQFGLEVSHASEVDEKIVAEANKIFESKAALQPKQELIVPASAVEGPKA